MSTNMMVLVIALLGYGAWQAVRSLRDAGSVPHWTSAIAVGLVALLIEGHALTHVLGGSLGWTYQVMAVVGFALIAPTTLAWTVVGALWLNHRAQSVRGDQPRPQHAARFVERLRNAGELRTGARTVTN